MNRISAGLAIGIMTGLLVLTSAMTNSALAIPLVTSQKGSGQSSANMMAQLLSGKNLKIGNMTLGFRPGVMVMPLMCMTLSGNLTGLPMLGNMMARNMNQSSMMGSGAQGNPSMNGLGAMMMRSGMVPSVCFSMSDALLFRSMMMHGGALNDMMMGANMTATPSMASSK
jgi:hypothetical protein